MSDEPSKTADKSGKVKFIYTTRVCRDYKNGIPVHVGKGTPTPHEDIARPVAEKWAKAGLGYIDGESQPLTIKAA